MGRVDQMRRQECVLLGRGGGRAGAEEERRDRKQFHEPPFPFISGAYKPKIPPGFEIL
jgi:hypothetical protein